MMNAHVPGCGVSYSVLPLSFSHHSKPGKSLSKPTSSMRQKLKHFPDGFVTDCLFFLFLF